MSRNFEDLSRDSWRTPSGDAPSTDQLKLGTLQRIAAATEKMAVNYDSIIKEKNAAENERDKYYRWYKEERAAKEAVQRSNSSLRGVITRMKNKQESEK